MSDDKAQEAIEAGRRVVAFLADPAVKGAMDTLSGKVIREWTLATTPETREAAWHSYNAVLRLEQELRAIVGRGQVAEERLSRP